MGTREALGTVAVGAVLSGIVVLLAQDASEEEEEEGDAGTPTTTAAGTGFVAIVHAHWRVLFSAGLFCIMLTVLRKGRDLLLALSAYDMGLERDQIGTVLGVAYLVDTCLFPVSGLLMDKVGRKANGILASCGMGLAFFLLPLGRTFGLLCLVAALGGAGNGVSSGLINTLGTDAAPAAYRSGFLGVFHVVTAIGEVLGPVLTGVISEQFDLVVAAMVFGCCGLSALWMACAVKETLVREGEEGGQTREEPVFLPLEEIAGTNLEEEAPGESGPVDSAVSDVPALVVGGGGIPAQEGSRLLGDSGGRGLPAGAR